MREKSALALVLGNFAVLGVVFLAGPAEAVILDVADIVGGGNGLGTGAAKGIEAHDGDIVTNQGGGLQNPANPGDYYTVPTYPLVDGVFVPNGTIGPQQITSTGLTFDFAGQATAHGSYNDFFNAYAPNQLGIQDPSNAAGLPDFFAAGNSIIGAHAQKAITFDLEAIRNEHGLAFGQFTAIIGDSRPKPSGSISYYALVDGVDKAHGFNMTNTEDFVDVSLASTDQYLTLVIANANDNNGSDHGYIGNAQLVVPEPATLLVWSLLAGLGVGLGWRRR